VCNGDMCLNITPTCVGWHDQTLVLTKNYTVVPSPSFLVTRVLSVMKIKIYGTKT
jgi:hypothetical protein